VSFAAGETGKPITINVNGDATVEPDEGFTVTLSGASGGAQITTPAATGTIQNDDATVPAVTVAVTPASVLEDGTTNLVYTFTRSAASASPLTVSFSVGGTATYNTDYTQSGAANFSATSGTVTILAGSATAMVTIDPTADATVEPDEAVVLTVTSGTGYTVGTPSTGTGTILNDDGVSLSQKFDFGTSVSPLAAGYTRVTAATTYNATLGYGWTSGAIQEYDRQTGSDLERDFNYTADGTFEVNGVSGSVTVTIWLGDKGGYAHDQMGVYLEGAQVDSVTTAAGQVVSRTYSITTTDGKLTLQLKDLGGSDPFAIIEGLEIAGSGMPAN